tara:strand:+ start:487 stop:858 length:372 start_codon:yes stop_codon:yes gene_type:complete
MALKAISETELTAEVVRLMLEGHSLSDVIEYMQKGNKQLTSEDATLWAFSWFEQSADIPAKSRLGWCLEAYRELYRKMVEVGDFNGAVKCVTEINKLSKGENKSKETVPITAESWESKLMELS